MKNLTNNLSWDDFLKVDMRVGTIIEASLFKEARNPAYKLIIDFGSELGLKKSSAQITTLYNPQELIGKQIIAVVNFPEKQIANLQSQCLVMGAVIGKDVTLITIDKPCANGLRIA
ncbi:tRNA-binding protein [Myroides sp. LJL119]